MLVSVFDHYDSFLIQADDEEEAKIPRLFRLDNKKAPGVQSIVSEKQFPKNFSLFTENQLSQMNWDNVFVAGGSVLGKESN